MVKKLAWLVLKGDSIKVIHFLSTFLFCLMTLLKEMESKIHIQGCKVAWGAPFITHLFFADDCYLFFKSTSEHGNHIKSCMSI